MQKVISIESPTVEAQSRLDAAIARAEAALIDHQRPDGHWVFELEADATIPAEYVLLDHFLGRENIELERKIAAYLRRTQGEDGGWPLVKDGALNVSATVKAYFALKMIGDSPEAPHMKRAREAVLAQGGAETSNVFTRFQLALYGITPWTSVPAMPIEMLLLPGWFPVHLTKMSYWSRTVIVPLLVLQAVKPRARNPRGTGIDELFRERPGDIRQWPKGPQDAWPWAGIFRGIDLALKKLESTFPKRSREQAIAQAVAFVTERLNGEDGLGGIFPAMANAEMMFDALGYPADHSSRVIARQAIEKLLCVGDDEAYCQPCLSPVWDTGLACHALLEVGSPDAHARVKAALDWLMPLQVLDVRGDWIARRPNVRPGGWAFQYANAYYPDVDDTAVVVMAMDRVRQASQWPGTEDYQLPIERAREWIEGLQSSNGGWAAFDADNTHDYLNAIPFADHGALLDPPTADVTARCVGMLAQLGDMSAVAAALRYLAETQEPDGSWYGRWGMNYVYGTWSVLNALNAAGVEAGSPMVRRAVEWLVGCQNDDGGWGEDAESYKLDYHGHEPAPSTASQTAWAVLGLMAVGQRDIAIVEASIERGIAYLLRTQDSDGLWAEERYTGTGFPRVFYLRYHGYPKIFPLWALARYRNLRNGQSGRVLYGL